MLGPRFRARAFFSSCGERGPLFIAVRGPLTIVASLVAEHRLQTRRLSRCRFTGPVAPRHVGSSRSRVRTHVPRIGRQTLKHCATREALAIYFTFGSVYMSVLLSHFVPAYSSPSPCPQVHSLRLRLYSGPAPRFFRTFFFFFYSIYIC